MLVQAADLAINCDDLTNILKMFLIRELKPVCGKNGITYNNPCMMICAGSTSQCDGNCPCSSYGGVPNSICQECEK